MQDKSEQECGGLLWGTELLWAEVEPPHPLVDQLDGSEGARQGQSPPQQSQRSGKHGLRLLNLTRVEQHLQPHSIGLNETEKELPWTSPGTRTDACIYVSGWMDVLIMRILALLLWEQCKFSTVG